MIHSDSGKKSNSSSHEEKADAPIDLPVRFIIMPFSAPDGYSPGHFDRVYKHIIEPAILKTKQFQPLRVDHVSSSNFIALDVVHHLVNDEMCICDLSSRNPNVFFELGVRQAFGLPVTLLKDDLTDRVFDIEMFRYIEYDSSLRVDTIDPIIARLAESIRETYSAHQNGDTQGVNSLIQLLKISPATGPTSVEVSKDTALILTALNDFSRRIDRLEIRDDPESMSSKAWFSQSPTSEAEILSYFPGDLLLLAIAIYESGDVHIQVSGKEFTSENRRYVRQRLEELGLVRFPSKKSRIGSKSIPEPPLSSYGINIPNAVTLEKIASRVAQGTLEGYERR